MSKNAEAIAADLRGEIRGEVRTDAVSRALYSTDASIFQVMPLAVVMPADEEDVVRVVRYAREQRIPLAARGGGSGMAGESLTSGIVLDFSKHFRRVLEVDDDYVRVQPGVVYQQLQQQLAALGRQIAIDTASAQQCTLGGMLANNASGARAVYYGYLRQYTQRLRCVWADGTVEECHRAEPYAQAFSANAVAPNGQEQSDIDTQIPPAELCSPPDARADNLPVQERQSRKQLLVRELTTLIHGHRDLLQTCLPRTRFNRCGYALADALRPEGFDLAGLLVGSEGTLALITEATLRTVPLPRQRAMVLVAFQSLEWAAQAAAACVAFTPSACELLDRRLLSLTLTAHPEYYRVVSPDVEAVLLVEFESVATGAVEQAKDWLAYARDLPGVLGTYLADDPKEVNWLWQLRHAALPLLHALPGQLQPAPYIEDVAVPVEHLREFLVRVQELLQQHAMTAAFLIHAAAGMVHTRPLVDWRQPDTFERLRSLAEQVYEWVWRLGGTISAQHGVGLARSPWVRQQYGRLADLFREVKRLFDPANIFNPGKLAEVDESLARSIRRDCRMRIPSTADTSPISSTVSSSKTVWALRWPEDSLCANIQLCNGCGACRTESPAQRMCPLFRVRHEEAATPRAKANLMRSLLDGTLPADLLSADAVREVADLCVNCKMCALECPARVNVPKLMLEAKAQHVAENGLPLNQWVLARLEGFAAWVSKFAWLINAGLENPLFRGVLNRIFGLARRRRLPKLANVPFLKLAQRFGWTRRPRRTASASRVALFVDFYGNYVDTTLPLATVRLLQQAEIRVYVPPGQVNCGMAALACGDVDTARRLARRNLQIFGDLAREGFDIVCCEPTSAIMFRVDHANILDDPDVEPVAQKTRELASYLWHLCQQGKLPVDRLQPLPLNIGHHVPCHIKALGLGVHGPDLLRLIPQLQVHVLDVSCSGMAGPFGLSERNYADSLAAGRPMLERLALPAIHFGSSECSSCRLQIEDVTNKRALHPVQYLALAAGALPELEARLQRPLGVRTL
ncbi:MAG: FAD-linked oxidase C-terminal domain-containing protein [Gemmatales bacterium]|nr:FAD-binding protein [Gemmatales bacterium]MDW7995783.1 FAD-linked oxidase C-terminal domain-containing protein [Gemmatales bacterium]